MAKVELGGVIKYVLAATTVGSKNTPKQTFLLFIPGYQDEFGEKKGRDQEWAIDLIGEQVAKTGLNETYVGKRAKVTVYVESTMWEKDNKKMWIVNVRLASIDKLLDATPTSAAIATAPPPAAQSNPDDDDLPF